MLHAFPRDEIEEDCEKFINVRRAHQGELFEGFLGELVSLGIIEDAVLENGGSNGVLRIVLSDEEPQKMFAKKKE